MTRKTTLIAFRIPSDEFDIIKAIVRREDKADKKNRVTVSSFIRSCLEDRIREEK